MSRISRLVSFSRENETFIGDEEALNDASVHTDIVTDIEAPSQEIFNASDEMIEAQDEANSLQNTADMINETTESGGQGVDHLTAELVQEKIEAATEKYQLNIHLRALSRENFNTSSRKREISRQLAREAEEASKGIWERIKEAIASAAKWIKNLLMSWLTAHGRLHRRIKALKEKYNSIDESGVDPSKVEMKASRLGATNVVEEVNKLNDFVSSTPFEWFSYLSIEDAVKAAKAKNNHQQEFDAIVNNSKLKHDIDLFEACGGTLGGKSVRVIVKGSSDQKFDVKVDDKAANLKDTNLKGVNKKEGVQILDILDKVIANFGNLKKDVEEAYQEISKIYTAEQKEKNADAGTIATLKAVLPFIVAIKKVTMIGISTSMKVASVATEVCAKSIVGKEKAKSNQNKN